MKKEILIACSVLLLGSSLYASQAPAPKTMHPSWDVDKDGVNDCEKDGSCDHTVDYSLPRGTDVVNYLSDQFMLYITQSGSGAHYLSDKAEFWEHHGEAMFNVEGKNHSCRVLKAQYEED